MASEPRIPLTADTCTGNSTSARRILVDAGSTVLGLWSTRQERFVGMLVIDEGGHRSYDVDDAAVPTPDQLYW